jgi:hypothetical protein
LLPAGEAGSARNQRISSGPRGFGDGSNREGGRHAGSFSTPRSNGHYNQEDMMTLVEAGDAVLYDNKAVRAIMEAAEVLLFGCKPTNP